MCRSEVQDQGKDCQRRHPEDAVARSWRLYAVRRVHTGGTRAALWCKWERTATAFPLLPNYFTFKTILQLSLKNQAIEAHDSSSQTCTTAICWGKASAVRLWIVGRGGADSAAVR